MPDRPGPRTLGALSAGLLLGVVLGGLAGLLRAPRAPVGDGSGR